MITIVDYGMGNLGSIANMLKRIGVRSSISCRHEEIAAATKIILPGVGAFDAAMERIASSGLRPILDAKALEEKIPVLGICLGMQLLTHSSEEGRLPGLGWIPARTLAFRPRVAATFKVPHMGWNVASMCGSSPLTSGLEAIVELRFYFVHSYFVQCEQQANRILTANFGLTFDAGIQSGNIYGVQFHPEKSHRFGMSLLQNFARL